MSWTQKRKSFVTFVVGATLFCGVALVVVPFLIEEPTCTDKKQNGTESGIDCGGGCSVVCSTDNNTVKILWERAVLVDTGLYDAVAYISNTNNIATPRKVRFSVTVFDKNGDGIATREGESLVRAGAGTALYVSGIETGGRVVGQTRFTIQEISLFERVTNQATLQAVQVIKESFENASGKPRLTVDIKNDLFDDVPNLDLIALLFDEEDTLVAIGKTFIERVPARGTARGYFSWRLPFSKPARTEIQLLIPAFK